MKSGVSYPLVRWALLLCLVWGLLAPGKALAGKLVIDVSCQTRLEKGDIRALLSVTNRGDEAALNLQAQAPGIYPVPQSALVDRLEPGQSTGLELRLDRPGPLPGTYIRVALVNFQDSGGRSFSAPAEVRFNLGQEARLPLEVLAGPVPFSDRRLVRVGLLNKGSEPLDLEARVVAPREISAARPRSPIRVEPGREKTIRFDLWNLSGLAGSTYPVILLLESRAGGVHAARAVRIMAALEPRRNPIRAHLEWWLAAMGACLGLLVAAQFVNRGRS